MRSLLILICTALLASCTPGPTHDDALNRPASIQESAAQSGLIEPPPGAQIPADLAAPRFRWPGPNQGHWLVELHAATRPPLQLLATENPWVPAPADWDLIRALAPGQPITVRVLQTTDDTAVDVAHGAFTVSTDPLAAQVLYLELPVPFKTAEKNIGQFRWRVLDPSASAEPRTVIQNLPYCANCHTLSDDGRVFGLDMDYRGDKGGFALAPVEPRMVLRTANVMSWNNFEPHKNATSRGLFARISPRGDFVAATIQERPFMIRINDPAYSQLFFPLSGRIAFYTLADRTVRLLPGASDPGLIQTNPVWTPDGEGITFARGTASADLWATLGDKKVMDAAPGETIHSLNHKHRIRFDLWHLPFRGGHGGEPAPIAGASNNGKSNYFPRYSPDGDWLVFCQAETGLVSQPGSKLVMLPARGGKPRDMRCNRPELNSWHSFSPNGRWMLFSSKGEDGVLTRVFITHIDALGQDSPAIQLHRIGQSGFAAILPEALGSAAQVMQSAVLAEP